jgi:hypothetical protein
MTFLYCFVGHWFGVLDAGVLLVLLFYVIPRLLGELKGFWDGRFVVEGCFVGSCPLALSIRQAA